jgi:glycerol-3-phosphate dehydrogenase
MIRHLARLADRTFDAVVIGGGVYGLSTALALLQRGLSVALVERRDFGGATSFNSLKTVHGGIRSLQRLDLADTREFVRERRAVATLAPHLVRVMPFIVPTALHPVRNRAAMGAFFRAYDLVASDRNTGLDPAVHLPGSYTVNRREALELNPLVDPSGVRGGAVWHDYQLHSPERFTALLARSCTDAGGELANYAEVEAALRDGSRVTGVRVRDTLTHDALNVHARIVVNTTGPWSWTLLDTFGIRRPTAGGFSLALNLVLDRPPLPRAVGGIAAGRFLFLVPWRDRSILGTSHEGFIRDPGHAPTEADVAALLRDGQTAFPGARLSSANIRLVHRGLLPARAQGNAHGALLKRSLVVDHRTDGVHGLVSVIGVRYTTARATAQLAAAQICEQLGRPASIVPPAPLAGAAFGNLDQYLRAHAGRQRLVRRYGTLHTELPPGDEPLAPATPVTRAEVLYAVRAEMAVTLADVALRRTDLAAGGHPGDDALRAAASIMAGELGWSAERQTDEIRAVEREIMLPETPAPTVRTPSG